jgi:hypothetical protein
MRLESAQVARIILRDVVDRRQSHHMDEQDIKKQLGHAAPQTVEFESFSPRASVGSPSPIRKLWLRLKVSYLRGVRGNSMQQSNRRGISRGGRRIYTAIDPAARLTPRAILINGKIRAIEHELGIQTLESGPALQGEQLTRAMDKHADSLARWREEDERMGRKR